jgi:TatD DNase family protein
MEKIGWIDAHCHLADKRFEDIDGVLERSRKANIIGWIQGGIDPEDWHRQGKLKERFGPHFLTAFGLHPWWVAQATESQITSGLAELQKKLPNADAAGEMGLDLMPKYAGSLATQVRVFQLQWDMAQKLAKPLIFHIVKGHTEVLKLLEKKGPQRGIIHSFSGSPEEAKRYCAKGFLISISGVILRQGYEKVKKTVSALPPEQLVLETDSPDQGLAEVNEPAFLGKVAEAAAALRKTEPEKLLDQSRENLKRVFKI